MRHALQISMIFSKNEILCNKKKRYTVISLSPCLAVKYPKIPLTILLLTCVEIVSLFS